MKDRCAGSLLPPIETAEHCREPGDRRPTEELPTLGVCGHCKAWVGLLANGSVRVHVDWIQRRVRTNQAARA